MASARERQAKRRAKIKANPSLYSAYLEKDRKRKGSALIAAKALMTVKQKEEFRVKERLRMQALRAAKKPQNPGESSNAATPYRSTQSLGKAVKRARTSLPKSPRKQRCVVSKLAESVGLKLLRPSTSRTHGSTLSDDTERLVLKFYSSDISWQAPGRKDRVIIRESTESGEKVKRTEQVRYMLMSLKEAYSKFKDENCSTKIGLAKFCELRPTHVKLPHQVCVCSYHENVRLLLVALKDHVTLGTDFSEFIDLITCDSSSKECMNGECSSCQNSINEFVPDDGASILCYQQWRSVDNRAEKVDISGTAEECFLELKGQVRPFLLHTYTKRNQSASFKSLVAKCNGKSVVLQVDFSENATIASQREIQSAHWNHGQATLFTAHAWSESQSCSMVIVSDDFNHTKHSVYVYMQSIFAQLMASYPSIEKIDVFSDGPTSQFKQRFLFSNLYGWEMEHDLKIR